MTLHDVGQHNRVPVTHRGDHAREPSSAPRRAATTHTGTVRFFNTSDGCGRIIPDTAGRDVFVHRVQLAESNMPTIVRGQRLQYEIGSGTQGRGCACNIRPAPDKK